MYESRAQFRFPYNGNMYDVMTANQALLDTESRLVEFDLLVSVDMTVVSAHGEVTEDEDPSRTGPRESGERSHHSH